MGCAPSNAGREKISPATDDKHSVAKSYTMTVNDKCPHIRVDCCKEVKSLKIDGEKFAYNLSYCYVSQRGYYPHALNKANQDSYVICENILGEENTHLFGIFDGHGEYGDLCSHYSATQVPFYLEKALLEGTPKGVSAFSGQQMKDLYTKAFTEANKALHSSPIDDSLSGTTGITVVMHGSTLYVANVGDSRAILATEDDNGKLVYAPLSSDQTPYRKDERERTKLMGARIMTLEQIEGHEPLHENWGEESGDSIDEVGDPPRIWDSSLERPGCAFTRSLGDMVAEQVGVNAVPEILTWDLTPKDKFIVIASDGVFEFLTSQAVVEILSKFEDPVKGAKHVIAESYRLWLTYDERTDDISMIVIHLRGFIEKKSAEPSTIMRTTSMPTAITKPVRSNMSKNKRKVIMEQGSAAGPTEVFDFNAEAVDKSPEELARLEEMVRSNFMFMHLTNKQRGMIYLVMKLRKVSVGELIIKEGDPGDEMYVVNSGEFAVLKRDENGVQHEVLTYSAAGAAFGELSLMYGEPRAASVKARTEGSLYSIGRLAFRTIIMNKRSKGSIGIMRGLPIFRNLSYTSLQRLCEMSTEVSFLDEKIIFDSIDWSVALILAGSVRYKDVGGNEKIMQQGTVFSKPEFGETASAIGKASLLFLPTVGVKDIMGGLNQKLSEAQTPVSRAPTSIFRNTDQWGHVVFRLDQLPNRKELVLESPILSYGDYGYLGNFKCKNGDLKSMKLVAKMKAHKARMDDNILSERVLLSSLKGECPFVSKVLATFQDDKIVMLMFEDLFFCDLSTAIQGVPDATKTACCACVLRAIVGLHTKGIMHRLVNPSSVYITSAGVPKLTDLTHAKTMDGGKTYTICGDPLYFAPEIIGQQGYDYAVDLWAFGVMVYELFESVPPFGTEDAGNAQIFKTIIAYRNGDLKLSFTQKSPAVARDLVSALLVCDSKARLGYMNHEELKQATFFAGVDWTSNKRVFENLQPVVADPAIVLDEAELEPHVSDIFLRF